MKPAPLDIDTDQLDALIRRLQDARDYQLTLSAEDINIVLSALVTLAEVQAQLGADQVTIHKLKKLLGMVRSSEKLRHLVDGAQDDTPPEAAEAADEHRQQQKADKKRARRRKQRPRDRQEPVKVFHALADLARGAPCPCCNPGGDASGKVYKYEPAQFLRISGHSPLTATLHLSERVRCNRCGEFFTAALPDEVIADGAGQQKYGYSARTVMALHKYFAGSPFYRQESLQDLLGLPLTASTVFDQCEHVANALFPVFNQLKRLSAEAVHYHLDDTRHRILDQQPIEKPQRKGHKTRLRSGIYTSGVIATLTSGQAVVLFQTNIGHAGEWLDELLLPRSAQSPPPLLMSDALSSNRPSVIDGAIRTLCNAHARRQFVDVMNHFPGEVADILKRYHVIWQNEGIIEEQELSPPARLAYHRAHSLPVMEELRARGQQWLAAGDIEANSGLGQAIAYFERHYEGLSAFCHHEGATLDNNAMEGQLKLVVRNRKNAYFYKTLAGAGVADVITSLIATASQAGINVFDYFNAVQRNAAAARASPENWLPWNYREMR